MKWLRLQRSSRLVLVAFLVAVLLGVTAWAHFQGRSPAAISSFATCQQAGYAITDSNPPVCRYGNRNFTGPISSPPASSTTALDQPFELLVDADSHGGYPRSWQVIDTQSTWTKYWSDVHSNVALPPLIPVDFRTSEVIALSEGGEPTAGYKVEVTSISTSPTGTVVELKESRPRGCIEPQHVTNPYYLVRTTRLPGPVSFHLTAVDHNCNAASGVQ